MLIGEYKRKLDTKRRLFVPSQIRASASWIITLGLEKCLFLFPEKEWLKMTSQFADVPMTQKDNRAFLRIFLSRATQVKTDTQGRVIVPRDLIDSAELKDRCTMIGMLNRIEIWSDKNWKKYSEVSQGRYEELAENITKPEL